MLTFLKFLKLSYLFPNISLTLWMNCGMFFSALTHLYISKPYFPPFTLSATEQKTSAVVKVRYRVGDRVCLVSIPSLSGNSPQCFCALSAVHSGRYASTLPCAQLCSTPCSAQMSTQFTAHTKLDHFSGVLCRPRTCCSATSLIKD